VSSIHFIDTISLSPILSIISHNMIVAILLVLPALFWASGAVNLEDLFQLKDTGPGACGDDLQFVQEWFSDTINLVDTAIEGLGSLGTDVSMQKNLGSWFKIRVTSKGAINKADQTKFNTVQSKKPVPLILGPFDHQVRTHIPSTIRASA
jgi:hypothetical protein